MSFKSLNDILGSKETQAKWQDPSFSCLLKFWHEVVGAVAADHTRPLSIQRDVLRVATSSAAWAQNLTFERQRLLQKLNAQLPSPLVDIRFSTAGWHQSTNDAKQSGATASDHPSYIGDEINLPTDLTPTQENPNAAFQHMIEVMQQSRRLLPLCPQCQCPTPVGELQRWDVCSVCATKRWQPNRGEGIL